MISVDNGHQAHEFVDSYLDILLHDWNVQNAPSASSVRLVSYPSLQVIYQPAIPSNGFSKTMHRVPLPACAVVMDCSVG